MKKHNVFLLFTSITALLFCACSSELKEKENASSKPGTVTLSIANDTQRTISPASGISYKGVSEWTVTFEDITESRSEKYNDIVKTVSFSESANQQIQLPLGTYNVTLNGTANKATSGETATTQTVPFYGESTVTVEDGKSASISVFVAPKKSEGGTGSFNFTVTTSGEFGNYTPVVSGNYFTVSLTPYGGKNPVAAWTPTEISRSASVTEAGSTYSFSVSSGTPESIPSGFYTLSIKYTWVVGDDSDGKPLTKDKEIYYPYHDFLVEIVDGLETKGSADITVSLEDSKTYYATKGETIGNGAFESMPGYLDNVLDAVNKTTISTANIYIVDEVLTNETSTSYPEIDVSKVNATGKTYCIYTKNANQEYFLSYMITGSGEEVGEPIIDINSSVTTVTLKNSQSSSGISGRAKIVSEGRPSFVLKDNTSVFIDLTDSQNEIAGTIIYMPLDATAYSSYYIENPCVTVKKSSSSTKEFKVFLDSNDYSVVTNSSDDETYKTTNFYIIPSYATGVSVEGIPNYSLVATKGGNPTESTQFFVGDTVTITATSESEDGSFANGTTFAWFINGEQRDCTAQSYEITFGVNAEASNTIICLVGYNGGYATAGIELYAAEQTALLYTKYGLGYAKLADLNETTQVTEVLNFDSYPISDFCIDTKTNDVYIIYADGNGNPYIEKATYYHANTDMHYASVDYASSFELNLIRMGNDNKLYVKFSLISDGMAFGIVDLLPNETGTQGAANIPQYLKMSEVSVTDQIMSFCVDDAGIMYITYKDSESNILLGKFSIKEGVLTQEKSIILATISSTDKTATSTYFNGISSALKVTDMHYEDGHIYLIVRDVFIDYSTPTDTVRSLGGVCKIKADTLTLADSSNPLTGWATTKIDTTQDESGKTIYNYKHAENEASQQFYFYGPQKIIAIKPKEIVIADDGASIDNSQMHQENRVVLFNLETNSITGVKTSPKEFYFSTSGGDNMSYQPN